MSNRERAIKIIDSMDDNQLVFIINILESVKGIAGKSDEFDLMLARDGEVDNDEEYTSEEVYSILGIDKWNIK